MEATGWLFDVHIQNDEAVLWIKSEDGNLLRLTDRYAPFFHVRPATSDAESELLYRLAECPVVGSVSVEEKRTSLEAKTLERLVRVETRGTGGFRTLVDGLESSHLVSGTYNVDFRHSQRYLLARLMVEPTSRVVVEHDGGKLSGIEKVDDSQELIPPPFTMLRFRIDYNNSSNRGKIITRIDTIFRGAEKSFEGSEKEVVLSFLDYVEDIDPDILFCPKCDEFTFPLLKEAARVNGIGLNLGRCDDGEQVKSQGSYGGRVVLGDIFYGYNADDWGIAGLVERTRFAFLPMGLATRWKSNKSIDSRNCFELMQRGYAIPRENYFEFARSLRELVERDRGGMIMTPEVGLHENVAAIDFDSQFPSLIIKNKLSYEGIDGGNEVFRLIPRVIEPFTRRRLSLKRVRKTLPKGSDLRRYCEQRVETLKLINVTQYGIAGCCWNRFGNVLTFEQINKDSREVWITAKSIAEREAFRVVYGNVDSLFPKKADATKEDYEELASKIANETGLPMSLDKHFRFLAFLPLRSDPNSSAINHFFGLTYDGEIEARGIELRRGDTPEFVRAFQVALIGEVLNCRNLHEVCAVGVRRGMDLFRQALAAVKSGRVDPEKLTVMKTLRKEVGEYRASVAHRSAALQLLSRGREVAVGDGVSFVYVDADHPNPLCRIRAAEYPLRGYDREMYAKMIREAAGTIFKGIGASARFAEDGQERLF